MIVYGSMLLPSGIYSGEGDRDRERNKKTALSHEENVVTREIMIGERDTKHEGKKKERRGSCRE